MKTASTLVVAALALACSLPARAEFYSGNQLLDRLTGDRQYKALAAGFIVGVHDTQSDILICSPANVTIGQMVDMVETSLRVNPATRHKMATVLVTSVLRASWPCNRAL